MKIDVSLSEENVQGLEVFKPLLAKDANAIINEALALYFKETQERLEAENSSQTNLSYDEFWDDLEI